MNLRFFGENHKNLLTFTKFLQKLLQFRGKPQRIPYNTIKAAAGGKPAATLIV